MIALAHRQMVDIGRRRMASRISTNPHRYCFMDGLDALDGTSFIKEKGESVVAYRAVAYSEAEGTSQEPFRDATRRVALCAE
jgi:hypothetical protein